jgi:hypothetical protein
MSIPLTALSWLAELAAAVNQVLKNARESEEWGCSGQYVQAGDFERLKGLSESLKKHALDIEEGKLIFRTHDHPEADGRQPQAGDEHFPLTLTLEGGAMLEVRMGRQTVTDLFNLLHSHTLADANEAPGGQKGTCPECHGTHWHLKGDQWECDYCHWHSDPPSYEGPWELRGDEVEGPERVNVFYHNGNLCCDLDGVGVRTVHEITNGLTRAQWKAYNS